MTDLNQKRHKVFYGWWIVSAIFVISAYASGVVAFGFTALFEPITREFGWSYTQVSFAASIRGLEQGLLAPLVGLFIDRWGPRKLLFLGIISVGLGLFLLSRITSLVTFYGVIILIATGMSTCTGTLPMTVVGNWFRKRVSLATGIVVSGIAFGGLLVLLVTRLIDIFEWRGAMMVLGIVTLVIMLPLSLIVRHKPEQYGYLPDGSEDEVQVTHKGPVPRSGPEAEFTVKQVLKSRRFWHIALGLMFPFLAIAAVTTHVMPYLSTVGIARSTASLVASVLPITSVLGRLSFGWIGDRFDKRWVAAISCALVSLSMLFFNLVASGGPWLLLPFIILFGLGWGGNVPMQPALLREYFGRARLGSIMGMVVGMISLGSILGSPLAGWVFDKLGSYHGAWSALAGITIIGTISLLTTPPASPKLPALIVDKTN